MSGAQLTERIKSEFDRMPAQMQSAARFILENPSEVALLSMREQARLASVPPATMTRLAQRLGLSGYDELKAIFADNMRDSAAWFSGRAEGMLSRREKLGEKGLVSAMAESLSGYISALASPKATASFIAAADCLSKAERILCIGARASFPVAYQFSYVQSYFWDRAMLLDGPGNIGLDPLRRARPNDVLFAVSFDPYALSTIEAVELAARAGVPVVAITDSELSVIGRLATVPIIVPVRSPSFFDTISPAFAAAEILMALLASRLGSSVPDIVRQREQGLTAAGVWLSGTRPANEKEP
ncbi:MurR/RpiR family transcriptional regulator [Rhodoligotrophos defluvii]|uniref:MurR/RpiR family transcriptional regulator n=1 Tax=Rhodoligotrophos defluvii TaxID=2561934 RepID=UPI0010CA03BB|nr:MurR/RpiR family transcriptional regulator [Rhodoligotrophos defluvii]